MLPLLISFFLGAFLGLILSSVLCATGASEEREEANRTIELLRAEVSRWKERALDLRRRVLDNSMGENSNDDRE